MPERPGEEGSIFARDFWLKSFQDPTVFWVMLGAAAAVVLIVVAYQQLGTLSKTAKSDFLYKVKKDFFTEDARRLIFLTENDLLEFRRTAIPYFEISGGQDPGTQKRMQELGITDSTIGTYLVDDVLLGPLEDIGILLRLKLVSLEETYEHFDTYVADCFENAAVHDYIRWCREGEENEDIWDGIEELHDKLAKEGLVIRERKRKKRASATVEASVSADDPARASSE